MNLVIVFIVGVIIGLIVGYFIGKQKQSETFVNDAEKMKSENMVKLKEYLSDKIDNEINNADVRQLLGISDATACRYLNDLEKEGLIKQVGTDGPKVYYQKN